MDDQERFEQAVSLGLRAAIVVLERSEGIAGIERLIWRVEHPCRLASVDTHPKGQDPAEGFGS